MRCLRSDKIATVLHINQWNCSVYISERKRNYGMKYVDLCITRQDALAPDHMFASACHWTRSLDVDIWLQRWVGSSVDKVSISWTP